MKKFENFCFWVNGQEEGTKMPFLFAIKDRESKDERWVFCSLTNDEVTELAYAINNYYSE